MKTYAVAWVESNHKIRTDAGGGAWRRRTWGDGARLQQRRRRQQRHAAELTSTVAAGFLGAGYSSNDGGRLCPIEDGCPDQILGALIFFQIFTDKGFVGIGLVLRFSFFCSQVVGRQ